MKSASIIFCLSFLTITGIALATGGSLDNLRWDNYPEGQKWKTITSKNNDKNWIIEKIPESSKTDDVSDLLIAQAFGGQKKVNAKKYAKNMMKAANKSCDGLRVNGPKISKEYGYEIAHGQIYCGKRKGADYGTETFFKVMKTGDTIYVVTREFRVPPGQTGGVVRFSKDEMAKIAKKMESVKIANSYLAENVYLCGPDIDDSRCKE